MGQELNAGFHAESAVYFVRAATDGGLHEGCGVQKVPSRSHTTCWAAGLRHRALTPTELSFLPSWRARGQLTLIATHQTSTWTGGNQQTPPPPLDTSVIANLCAEMDGNAPWQPRAGWRMERLPHLAHVATSWDLCAWQPSAGSWAEHCPHQALMGRAASRVETLALALLVPSATPSPWQPSATSAASLEESVHFVHSGDYSTYVASACDLPDSTLEASTCSALRSTCRLTEELKGRGLAPPAAQHGAATAAMPAASATTELGVGGGVGLLQPGHDAAYACLPWRSYFSTDNNYTTSVLTMAGARLHDLLAPVYNAPPSEMQHCVTTVGRNTPAALRYTHTGSNDAGIPELAEQGVWQWRSAAGMRPHPAGNNRVHMYDAPSA